MINFNISIILISATIPLIIGIIWYNNTFIRTFGFMELGVENTKVPKKRFYALLYIVSIAYSIALSYQVIHQLHFQSMFYNEVGFLDKQGTAFKDFEYIIKSYSHCFRTFKHGMFHGFLNSIFIVLPILIFISIFEQKSWRYVFIHWGFWAISGMIMGGIICQLY